jgi:hypothetical protein
MLARTIWLLAFSLLVGWQWPAPAVAQFNPAAPVVPSLPPPPTPPAATPGLNPQPAPVGASSASNPLSPVPGLRLGAPSAETHNDRSIRCAHQSGVQGVPPGQLGPYLQACANN